MEPDYSSMYSLPLPHLKTYHHIDEFVPGKGMVVTTGTFDGVHLGHRKIISLMHDEAERIKGETVLFTFFPHPRMILQPEKKQLLLNTIDERSALLEKAGVDHLIIHPFTREFSMLSSRQYIDEILVRKIHTRKLVIGHDHHFGRNREGSFQHLREFGPVYGFDVIEIPEQFVDTMDVSSTVIRNALEKGDVSTANTLLGYSYMLTGTVVKGRMTGRSIDFPTANIHVDDEYKLVPADGVYAVRVVRSGNRMKGMLNIGFRPTVDGKTRTIEVNILDFNGDLYGETLTLEFVKRIRDEMKFDGLDNLKKQLATDRENTRLILG